MRLSFDFISGVIAIMIVACPTYAQNPEALGHEQFPHPINATMGIPDPVGSYNVRLNGFRQVHNDSVTHDVSGHLSYGMFEWGGIHLRSLGVRTSPFTEVIGMVRLLQNASRTKGISLLGIAGIPTGPKNGQAHHGLSYLAGIAGRLALGGFTTNDVILHYDFTEGHFIAEMGSVLRTFPTVYITLDTRGTFGNIRPNISFLTSLKMQILGMNYLALGYHLPVTNERSFAHQIFVQVEIGSH